MAESPRPPATHKPGSGKLLHQSPRIEYSYHWGRILGLVLFGAALGAAALYGYNQWFAAPVADSMEVAELPQKAEHIVQQQPAETERLATDIPEPFVQQVDEPQSPTSVTEPEVKPLWEEAIVDEQILPETQSVVELEQAVTTEPPIPTEIVEETAEPAEVASTEEVSAEPVYHIDEMIPSETEITDAVAAPTEPSEVSESEPEIADVIPAASDEEIIEAIENIEPNETVDSEIAVETAYSAIQSQDLKINDPGVKRFQLAEAVENREPVGELSDIQFNPDGVANLWAFSEVLGMRGKQLQYIWLHEGEEIARVRINVGSYRWRSFSSKNIKQSRTGDWRVELRDGEDRLLASADFIL